jgi:hypothetical protein
VLANTLGIRDGDLQREVIKLLIDRLNERIRRLCGDNVVGGAFRTAWHVDVRGTIGSLAMWADELHPTSDGFEQVAARFMTVLTQALSVHETVAETAVEQPAVRPGDDAHVDPSERAEDWEAPPMEAGAWRIAKSLLRLREQVNARFPTRNKREDGAIGDAAHATRNSDHNPWVRDGSMGVVTAVDITHDAHSGCTGEALAEAIRGSRDPRVKYIIWNWRICSSSRVGGTAAWAWRPYRGDSPHNKHIHISVKPAKTAYDDASDWRIDAHEMAVTLPLPSPHVAGAKLRSLSKPTPARALESAMAAPPRKITPGDPGAGGELSRSLRSVVVKGKGEPLRPPQLRGGLESVIGPDDRVRILDTDLALGRSAWRSAPGAKAERSHSASSRAHASARSTAGWRARIRTST